MLKIWGRTSSINVQKVMWAVAELGLAHERIDAGGPFGGLDGPDYAAMNPNRLIPVLQDGATVRLGIQYDRALPRRALRRGRSLAGGRRRGAPRPTAGWTGSSPLCSRRSAPIFLGLIRTPPEKRDMALITASAERLGQAMTILDGHLATRPYVAGDALTMGDIPVGCVCWRYANLDIARPDLPNIAAYRARLEAARRLPRARDAAAGVTLSPPGIVITGGWPGLLLSLRDSSSMTKLNTRLVARSRLSIQNQSPS